MQAQMNMMVRRDVEGELTNAIVNHPQVLPTFTDSPDPIDMRPIAQDPHTIILVGTPPQGCFLFTQIVLGVYEAHGAVMPEGRGPWAQELAESCVRTIFIGTDAIEIMTRIPEGHTATLALVKGLGFQPRWSRPEILFRGKKVPFTVWSLTMQQWFPSDEAEQRIVLRDMKDGGPPGKADNWYARWARLSRIQ